MPSSSKPYVIVVAVDYSPVGDLALERALELAAEKPSAEVHVVNVLPVVASDVAPDVIAAWGGAPITQATAAEDLRSHVQARATDFRAGHAGAELGFLDKACGRSNHRAAVPALRRSPARQRRSRVLVRATPRASRPAPHVSSE